MHSGTQYIRTLRHGVRVVFDAAGRHIQTISRTGQTTTITYNGYGQVSTIAVPPDGVDSNYTFAYNAADSLLDKITDPGNRTLNVTVNPASRALTAVVDPDLIGTSFDYDTAGRMLGRTGRRNFRTAYTYAHGLRVTRVDIPIATGESAVTNFSPWDELGLQNLTPTDIAQAFTLIQGPRAGVADDAKITVDRWGAPTRIVDPIGAVTTLLRGDATVPLMVTQVTYPNPAGAGGGRIAKMTYDTRANLLQVRDSTSHLGASGMATKVTRYVYGDAATPDSPTQVIDSVNGTARTTKYTYTAQGLTNDALARGHRTVFGYTSDGLVNRVTELQVETWHEGITNDTLATKQDQVWAFDYDALRNLKADTSATGVVRSYVRDVFGRVTQVHDPLGTKTERIYDAMDRDTVIRQYTAAQPNPYGINPLLAARCDATQVVCSQTTFPFNPGLPATLDTRKVYSRITLDTVADARNVRRDFAYDARNVTIRERDDFGASQQSFVGQGGQLDSVLLRSGAKIRYTYDAAGRRTLQHFQTIIYTGHGTVPGDSIRYAYDTLGNIRSSISVNRGSVTRTYYANGLLKSKTAVNAAGLSDVITYSYDQAWAPARVIHNSLDTTDYAYDATTGDLASVTVRLGFTGTAAARTRTFTYLWDALGRLRQITYPVKAAGPMNVMYRYDAVGILRRLKSVNPQAGDDIFDIVLRNKSVDAVGRILAQEFSCPIGNVTGDPCGLVNNRFDFVGTTNAYNRLGFLAQQTRNTLVDDMRYDASGNMIFKRDGQLQLDHTYAIGATHNQLTQDAVPGMAPLAISYDANGSRLHEIGNVNDHREKHYYYDGLNRLTGTFVWVVNSTHDRPNDCQYDAEGVMAAACEGGQWLGFDGHNVSATILALGKGWTFFRGPGLDSPLMGYYRSTTAGQSRILYWVTDGNGRELAVADSAGVRQTTDQGLDIGAWRQAGGIANSYTFGNDRQDNANATDLSFYRNRVYDQNTGRWLQEDPIGLAGGLNLYQFNGNNPVTYTDPFGLKTCPPECGLIHAVGATGGAIVGGIVGAGVGAGAGTLLVPGPGTVAGGFVGGTEGAAVGAVGGLAAANVAEAVVDAGAQAMSKLSRLIGHIFIGGAVITNPGKSQGNVDTGDHTTTGTGQTVTEPNPKGKKERKDEEGGNPSAGE